MAPTIRDERAPDAPIIREVTRRAFLDAPHTDHTEHFIVDALRRSGGLAVSLVAEDDGAILGHVAASPVAIADGSADWYGIGPISVLPERQGQGIGSRLMERALADLRRRGAAGCVVLGEPAFYARFGFEAATDLILPGVPPEYFQAIAFREPRPSGVVAYHESFLVRE